MSPNLLLDLYTWWMGWDNNEEKWVQNIRTSWGSPLISQKPPAVAKATCLVWQIGPTSFFCKWKADRDSNYTKIKCKVTLHHRNNPMAKIHVHCDRYFWKTKMCIMNSNTFFSIMISLLYESNFCLLGGNTKLDLWSFKGLKNLRTNLDSKILTYWTFIHKIFKATRFSICRLLPLKPEHEIQCSYQTYS